jgi:hypothetical protein
MKRRQLLKFLGLAPPALLIGSSCQQKSPSSLTIITGTVIDGSGLPLPGAGLMLVGKKYKGNTPVPTFLAVTTESDNQGVYKFSKLIPKDTGTLTLLPYSTPKVSLDEGLGGYKHYIFLNGKYVELGSTYSIPQSDWGKTITLNYQFVKL